MKSCRECNHFNACEDWAHNFGLEDLQFPYECEDNEVLCDQYNPTTLPPAYIGQKVWVPVAWYNQIKKEIVSELREGKISMLQQKADKSWKFRVTTKYVADYTLDDIGEYIFFTKETAEEDLAKQIKKLEEEHGL